MLKTSIAKIAGVAVGATVAFGSFVPMAGAQSIAELQAQINALMAQLAALSGGSTVATSATFTQNLTLGSSGSEVVALQQMLVAQGHLVMPAGVAYGYFGPLTQSAVAKWQVANSVSPTSGYWGPISRAKVAGGATGTVPGTSVGTGTGSTGGTINTPGVEGILSASLAPTPSNGQTINEGDTREAVLGVELEADLSDIKIERIKVKLDDTTNSNDRDFYRDIASKMYVMEGSTVLASVNLDSNSVVEETSGNYYVTITGLNYIVRKDTEKTLTIAIDVEDNIDSTLTNGDIWTVTIPAEGIRGVDGAGVNQYSPATGSSLVRTFTVDDADSENATLQVSTNSGTPDDMEVVCNQTTSEDECDELELLRVDFEAEDDDVTLTDLVVDIVRAGDTSSATATTAYLYDGSTLLGSVTVAGTALGVMSATFDDLEFVIDEDSTETLVVKIDVVDVLAAETTFTADIDTADVTAENSEGDSITESGSAQGETISVRKVGLEVSLVSKSITTAGAPQSSTANSFSTSTLTATFSIKFKAVGGDILLGTVASGSPVFANTGANNSFELYKNGVVSAANVATSTSFTMPSACSSQGTATCALDENEEVTVAVTFQIPGRTSASVALDSGLYSVGIQGVQWVAEDVSTAVQFTDFMDGDTDWRTSDVSFP